MKIPDSDKKGWLKQEHIIYNKRRSYYEHMVQTALLRAYDWAKNYCKNKTVLEIGCGDMGGGELLLREVMMKKFYTIDYSLDGLISAEKRKTKGQFICSKGEELPFKGDKFDTVITFQVLEHILEYKKFLKEIDRVLKKNGVLLLSTPDYSVTKNINPYHVSLFDKPDLEILLNKYFEEVKMLYHYGADRFILRDLTVAGIKMPEEYIQAVNVGFKIGQISRRNRIVNWMIGSGRKGKIFKYFPLSMVNNIFKALTGHDYHWFQFKHIPLISDYPFHCLSFYCICKSPKNSEIK